MFVPLALVEQAHQPPFGGKPGLPAALHFDMHIHQAGLPRALSYAHQFVGQPLAQFGILHHRLQLGIQKDMFADPVDLGMGGGKVKRHEGRKVVFDGFFPGRVVIVGAGGGSGRCRCGLHRPHGSVAWGRLWPTAGASQSGQGHRKQLLKWAGTILTAGSLQDLFGPDDWV